MAGSHSGGGAYADPTAACAAAHSIALANGATIVNCQVIGAVVDVTANVTVDGLRYLGLESVSARARAGPQ